MRRTLLLILIICNSLLLIGFGWLYGRIRERDRAVSRLQEQVAFLTEYLPVKQSAGQKGDLQASDHHIRGLIEDLKKNNLIRQYQAGLRLKDLGAPAVPYLVEALKETKGKKSRAILILLESMGEKALTPELMEIYQSTNDTVNRAGIVTILGKWSDDQAKGIIQDAAKDQDWRIRAAAAQALSSFEGEDILTGLIQLLGDQNRYVRSAAQSAVKGLAESKEGVAAMTSILREGDSKTRFLLVKHLPKLAGRNATPLLRIAAQDKNKTISQIAIKALSEQK